MTFKQNYFSCWIWYFDVIHLDIKKDNENKLHYMRNKYSAEEVSTIFSWCLRSLVADLVRVFSESLIIHSPLLICWMLDWFSLHHLPLSFYTISSSLWRHEQSDRVVCVPITYTHSCRTSLNLFMITWYLITTHAWITASCDLKLQLFRS